MYYIYSFEKLEVYKESLFLNVTIREIVKSWPFEERYELTTQIKRSISSIAANIAEGSGRASNNDRAHYTNIAYSSALESISHLNLAK
ncbi:four helix bundle protein [Sphingobacterium wenxiniae]|uniref:Four helix bundle protein n=1 Tax=Sphingobacterium wenxiniae TaxID=683125 RepID=A0A1I6VVV2_9SPHI|nr:four helix bundle protein [Sphingobacterium wenxiniae]